jgi:hypothetical protein
VVKLLQAGVFLFGIEPGLFVLAVEQQVFVHIVIRGIDHQLPFAVPYLDGEQADKTFGAKYSIADVLEVKQLHLVDRQCKESLSTEQFIGIAYHFVQLLRPMGRFVAVVLSRAACPLGVIGRIEINKLKCFPMGRYQFTCQGGCLLLEKLIAVCFRRRRRLGCLSLLLYNVVDHNCSSVWVIDEINSLFVTGKFLLSLSVEQLSCYSSRSVSTGFIRARCQDL